MNDGQKDVSSRATNAPIISRRFACIVDRDSTALAAIISSYLFEDASYLPVFIFPVVKMSISDDAQFPSDQYISNLLGQQATVYIGNVLARIGGCEWLILAGLTANQKSFIPSSASKKIIEIATPDEIHRKLSSIAPGKHGELKCRAAEIVEGLALAQRIGKRLVIEENAEELPKQDTGSSNGIVVIERSADVSSVIAVNYANSVGAQVVVVEPLAKNQSHTISRWIRDWKDEQDISSFHKLHDEVSRRVGSISFGQFKYATFFTEGLPYALILENIIPFSHVHLSLRPDLFIMNNIIFSRTEDYRAAVVFSPIFFSDEETDWTCDFFARSNFYVRPLIGKDATVAKFDFHAQFFPYALMHICSHGGEVNGYEMSERFTDKDGKSHQIEFDEVVGFSPSEDNPDYVMVHRKVLPRLLDGIPWRSPELEELNLPLHVTQGMWQCMMESEGRRTPKSQVSMSCAIRCADSIHQGEFTSLASQSSPLVFNNTCWSWDEIAGFFLSCGARGYIGTLWEIENFVAVAAARNFYEHLFENTILNAFHKTLRDIKSPPSKNVYIYWGLHFTTVSPGRDIPASRSEVLQELVFALGLWKRKIELTKSAEIRRNSIRVARSIARELVANFDSAEVRAMTSSPVRQPPAHIEDERSSENVDDDRLRNYGSTPLRSRSEAFSDKPD